MITHETCDWGIVFAIKNSAKQIILRDGKIIIPNSNTNFRENDDVVFFVETQYINKLEKLLSTY